MKKISILLFLSLFLFTFPLDAEEGEGINYKELYNMGKSIQTTGSLKKQESTIFLQSNQKKFKLIFPKESNTLDKEPFTADYIYLEGKIESNTIAVRSLRYSNKIIEFSNKGKDNSKKYDIFIDYDGDGICDKRNNKLFFEDNLLRKFKSYQTIFGKHNEFKILQFAFQKSGDQGGGGGHHGGHGGGK